MHDEKSLLASIYILLNQKKSGPSDLSKQIVQKINILDTYICHIQDFSNKIKQSLRFIDLNIYGSPSEGSAKIIDMQMHSNVESKTVAEISKTYTEKTFDVTLNDLIVYRDIMIKDQAIQSIDHIYENNKDDGVENRSINIMLKNLTYDQAALLFSLNIDVDNITKDEALTQLKTKGKLWAKNLPQLLSQESYKIDIKQVGEEFSQRLGIKEILHVIERSSEESCFDLKFPDANEKAKKLNECLDLSGEDNMFLEFPASTKSESLKILEGNECYIEYADLEIHGSKTDLLKCIENCDAIEVQVFTFQKPELTSLEKLKTQDALVKVSEGIVDYIQIEKVETNIGKKIISLCQRSTFILKPTVFKIDLVPVLLANYERKVCLSFNNLTPEQGKKIIPQLRDLNVDFSTQFQRLRSDQVSSLMEKVSTYTQDITLEKTITLSSFFVQQKSKSLQELQEFATRGIETMVIINEKRPIPWFSFATLITIASLEMFFGALLIRTECGFSLVSEGAVDMLIAANVVRTREFSWANYGRQKVLSLGISVVSLGFSSFKNAVNRSQTFAPSLLNQSLNEGVEQATTRLILNGRFLKHIVMEAGNKLKGLSAKNVAVATVKEVVCQSLNAGCQNLSERILDRYREIITSYVLEELNRKLFESETYSLFCKICAVDMMKNLTSGGHLTILNKKLKEVLDPTKKIWSNQFKFIGEAILKSTLSKVRSSNSNLSLLTSVSSTLRSLKEVTAALNKVLEQTFEVTTQIDREDTSITSLIIENCRIGTDSAKEVTESLITSNIINKYGIFTPNSFHKRDSIPSKSSYEERQALEYLKQLNKAIDEVRPEKISRTKKVMQDLAVDQILQAIEGQLVSVSSGIAEGVTNAMSNLVEHSLIFSKNENSESQEMTSQVRHGERNTTAKQIQSNADEKMMIHSKAKYPFYQRKESWSNIGDIALSGINLGYRISKFVQGWSSGKPCEDSYLDEIAEKAADFITGISQNTNDAINKMISQVKSEITNLVIEKASSYIRFWHMLFLLYIMLVIINFCFWIVKSPVIFYINI